VYTSTFIFKQITILHALQRQKKSDLQEHVYVNIHIGWLHSTVSTMLVSGGFKGGAEPAPAPPLGDGPTPSQYS